MNWTESFLKGNVRAFEFRNNSVPKLSFGLGVGGENYPPKREKESGELLFGLDAKRVRKD